MASAEVGGPADVRQRLAADGLLLAVAAIWGSGFVPARVATAHLDPFLYNGARFFLGGLTLVPFLGRSLRGTTRREIWVGLLAGLVMAGAANVQQIGLAFTTAGKAGFITGLYVVLAPLFSALVSLRWPHWSIWLASLTAASGLYLLSGAQGLTLAPGDAWVFACAVLWAVHIVFVGHMIGSVDAYRLALIQNLVCGIIGLLVGLFTAAAPWRGWSSVWWAVLYNGLVSVGLGFTFQLVAQRRAPAADAAVILSLESVFAAFFGWLLLGERLGALQLLGCGLVLVAMLLAQIPILLRQRAEPVLQAGG